MWLPSLYAVLYDLWRFVWHSKQSPVEMKSLVITESIKARAAEPLLTLDVVPDRLVRIQSGQSYTDESPETIVIRQTLHEYDSHLVQTGSLTLLEWLLYTIHKADQSIALLALAMTPLGRWYQTLKAQSGVRVSIEPTTGALVEWSTGGMGDQVGIVMQVSPDQTIVVYSIHEKTGGVCQEQRYTQAQWKELGPIFTRWRS